MNQLPENSLRIYDVTSVTSYLIGLIGSDDRLLRIPVASQLTQAKGR